eukprot:278335-Chlamydomonas_euryale.AAC.2
MQEEKTWEFTQVCAQRQRIHFVSRLSEAAARFGMHLLPPACAQTLLCSTGTARLHRQIFQNPAQNSAAAAKIGIDGVGRAHTLAPCLSRWHRGATAGE